MGCCCQKGETLIAVFPERVAHMLGTLPDYSETLHAVSGIFGISLFSAVNDGIVIDKQILSADRAIEPAIDNSDIVVSFRVFDTLQETAALPRSADINIDILVPMSLDKPVKLNDSVGLSGSVSVGVAKLRVLGDLATSTFADLTNWDMETFYYVEV